jgi:Zn-dependent M28 family amino/carboxypeptidase
MITQEFNFRALTATNALFFRREISNGVILFAAHHDYCAGLGAVDNATALSIMLELAHCLEERESGVVFASFDLEELGLCGSRYFVESSAAKELEALKGVIALECIGGGTDVVICKEVAGAKSAPVLVESLLRAGRKLGHRILLEGFNWLNADHVPFAERGIRTVEVCSISSENYKGHFDSNVNVAHSIFDLPENVRPDTLQIAGEVLLQFLNDL